MNNPKTIPLRSVKEACSGLVSRLKQGAEDPLRPDIRSGDETEDLSHALEETGQSLQSCIRESESAAAGNGQEPGEITLDADLGSIPVAMAYVTERLEENGCPLAAVHQLRIAIDELFSNIVKYAGMEPGSRIRMLTRIGPNRAEITFEDSGIPFDPLSAGDPDITLPAGKRRPGGLGIFMVRKMMDEISYRYRDGKNRLTVVKRW